MPDKSVLNSLKWNDIASHFRSRVKTSKELLLLHDDGKVRKFAELAIGITSATGNYSAAEHPVLKIGITTENVGWDEKVFRLANKFRTLSDAGQVPGLITDARLKYLQISVGSEISCMVNPTVCWVCNVRTIWLHLAWTDGPGKAEQLLELYRTGASDSDMAYIRWADVYHPRLRATLIEVAAEGRKLAKQESITPSDEVFLWADAIASYAYDRYHG